MNQRFRGSHKNLSVMVVTRVTLCLSCLTLRLDPDLNLMTINVSSSLAGFPDVRPTFNLMRFSTNELRTHVIFFQYYHIRPRWGRKKKNSSRHDEQLSRWASD